MSLPITPTFIPTTPRGDDPSLKKDEEKARARQDKAQVEAQETDQRAAAEAVKSAKHSSVAAAEKVVRNFKALQSAEGERSFQSSEAQKVASAAAENASVENASNDKIDFFKKAEVQKAVRNEPAAGSVQQEGAKADANADQKQQEAQASLRKETDIKETRSKDARAPQNASGASKPAGPQPSPQAAKMPHQHAAQSLAKPASKTPPQTQPSADAVPERPIVADGSLTPEEAPLAEGQTPPQAGPQRTPGKAVPEGRAEAKPVVTKGVQMFAVSENPKTSERYTPEQLAQHHTDGVKFRVLAQTGSVIVPSQTQAQAAAAFVVGGDRFAKSNGKDKDDKVASSEEKGREGADTDKKFKLLGRGLALRATGYA